MTEKRYKVHNMIKGMNVGELVDLELMKELIEEYGAYENVDVGITNNGKEMTYKEVVDLLNENEQLKKENELKGDFRNFVNEDIVRIKKENEQLKKSIKRQQLSNEECSKYIEEVAKENKQLKQFKNKIFDILNKNINKYKEYHEIQLEDQSYNEAYAMECCVEALLELKKETYGDAND